MSYTKAQIECLKRSTKDCEDNGVHEAAEILKETLKKATIH